MSETTRNCGAVSAGGRLPHEAQEQGAQEQPSQAEHDVLVVNPDTLFARIGGADAVAQLVETFYGHMDALPEAGTIRRMHAIDLASTKDVLRRYLGEWMGGPKLYSQERGHPRLRSRHVHFKIGEDERDAWLACMRRALEETVAEPDLRAEIYAPLAKLADWMRNDPDCPHDMRHRL